MFNFAKQVNVLGCDYDIVISNEKKTPRDGLCYLNTKRIVINNNQEDVVDKLEKADIYSHKQKILRHEIVHAYAEESGIPYFDEVDNEFTVDWIAKQAPKILISFLECGALTEDVISKITKIINHQYNDDFVFTDNN